MQLERLNSHVPSLFSNLHSAGSLVKDGLRVITFLALTKIAEASNADCVQGAKQDNKITLFNVVGSLAIGLVALFCLGFFLIVGGQLQDRHNQNKLGNGPAPMGH